MEGLLSTGPTPSSFTKDHSLNQLMNDKGVCRTSPATPGLLNNLSKGPKKEFGPGRQAGATNCHAHQV